MNDSLNKKECVYLEIRPGTGGREAKNFALDLSKMYLKFSEKQLWKTENLSYNKDFKDIILFISGNNVYNKLKFESGVHRVQRIPLTENQGRLHTSTCTVAVFLKEENKNKIEIKKDDIKIDTFKSSGAGGQHVNKTNSAIRITHIPTKLIVECQNQRSQYQNKNIALEILKIKLINIEKNKKIQELSNKRKFLMGSGDRSEKIRTYNFSKNRLTDHRVNLVLYNLNKIMAGDLDKMINFILKKLDKID